MSFPLLFISATVFENSGQNLLEKIVSERFAQKVHKTAAQSGNRTGSRSDRVKTLVGVALRAHPTLSHLNCRREIANLNEWWPRSASPTN
jgi:hypothetical protein